MEETLLIIRDWLERISKGIDRIADALESKGGQEKVTTIKKEEKKGKGGKTSVSGAITNTTEKALMLMIDGSEEWYPKSTIHNDYQEAAGLVQDFVIDNWILKNKKVI